MIHKFCVQPQEKSLSVSIKVRMLLHFYYVKTFDLHCIIYCVVNTTSICQHSVFLRQTIYKRSWAFRLKTGRFRGWVFIWISTCIGIHVQDFDVVKKNGVVLYMSTPWISKAHLYWAHSMSRYHIEWFYKYDDFEQMFCCSFVLGHVGCAKHCSNYGQFIVR